MAKRIKELNIDAISQADIKQAYRFKNSNPKVKAQVTEFEKALREHFCFSEEEIAKHINFICCFSDETALEKLSYIAKSFADTGISSSSVSLTLLITSVKKRFATDLYSG